MSRFASEDELRAAVVFWADRMTHAGELASTLGAGKAPEDGAEQLLAFLEAVALDAQRMRETVTPE